MTDIDPIAAVEEVCLKRMLEHKDGTPRWKLWFDRAVRATKIKWPGGGQAGPKGKLP